MTEARVEQILEAFRINLGEYKRVEVDDAIQMKEEITPHLIEILQRVLADPEAYGGDPDYIAQIYAVMLLAHFRETAAHKLIVDLFSLQPELVENLFEDVITEGLPAILFRTCGGNLEPIKSLVLNRQASVYCRGSAMRALAFAVAEGSASREEILAFLGTLLTGNEAEPDSPFWDFVASRIYDLHPAGMMDRIRAAYDSGLINEDYIGYRWFEEASQIPVDESLKLLREEIQRRSLDDLHAAMSWWNCFQIARQDRKEDPGQLGRPESLSKQAKMKKKARKKKRKTAKASRKGNR